MMGEVNGCSWCRNACCLQLAGLAAGSWRHHGQAYISQNRWAYLGATMQYGVQTALPADTAVRLGRAFTLCRLVVVWWDFLVSLVTCSKRVLIQTPGAAVSPLLILPTPSSHTW